jgi:hypothetical protein
VVLFVTAAPGGIGPTPQVVGTALQSSDRAAVGATSPAVAGPRELPAALVGTSAATLFAGSAGPIGRAEQLPGTVLLTVSSHGKSPLPRARDGSLFSAVKEAGPARTAAQRKALAVGLRYLYPDMTDDQIARAAGVSRRTLFRWAEYNTLKKAQRELYKLPRGFKDKDGNLEAWADEEE